MFAKYTVLAAAALLAAGAANAQVGATADLGSTGVGFHVVVPMETYLNGRFGANYFRHNFDKTSDGVDYDIKGKLQTFDVLFDWYLTEGSSFHLTGGLVYNGNKFNAKAKPNGVGGFTLNGHAYTAADVGLLTGRIDYRKAAPYLGIGWGNALAPSSGWTTNIDLGVFYQGNPNVQLASVGCTVSNTVCKALANDVAVERLRLRDDVDALKVYPVVRASIGYRF
ncbi:hypothetical protein SAMN05428966_103195 [Massilia sp. PDC64]|nr:hypothetical protein [Massilia sp. PDC64]SDD09887.1 hypothetical protein SAMN05428966_103195 [Massilia sp. PDC64]